MEIRTVELEGRSETQARVAEFRSVDGLIRLVKRMETTDLLYVQGEYSTRVILKLGSRYFHVYDAGTGRRLYGPLDAENAARRANFS